MLKNLSSLKTARYFPLLNGKYEIKPGLFSLNTDFGNNQSDKFLFQIDQNYTSYRDNKNAAHQEQLDKYYCCKNFSAYQQQVICNFIILNLCHNYPQFFSISKIAMNTQFKNSLLNEEFIYSPDMQLITTNRYQNLLDALLMQVQEDIAVIAQQDYIACLHLMAPNFWSPQDKIGNSFSSIHRDVAGIESIIKNAAPIVHAMINRGPYVRFAWGLTSNQRLNHHPDNFAFNQTDSGSGRDFIANKPRLYLRVERQTTTGFPDSGCALFTIRSYHYDTKYLAKTEIQCIIDAIKSMTQNQLRYKGLHLSHADIIKWLTTLL